MKSKIIMLAAVFTSMMMCACSASDESGTVERSKVNGGILMSRSNSENYINSLVDNNTFIDLDPNVPANLGEANGMDSIAAKYRVALYRIYSATKINDGLLKVDATADQLNLSPRLFNKYRKMLEGEVNTTIIKLRAEGNDDAIKQILAQFEPERIDGVIHPRY